MNRSRWLAAIALTGVGLFALSFADGWIVHEREVRGEGSRFVEVSLSAWQSVGMPVLTAGALASLGAALAAVVHLRRPYLFPRWMPLAGSMLALALISSAAVPIAQDGHASSVHLSAGWLSIIGIGFAGLMVVATAMIAGPSARLIVVLGVLGAVTFGAGAGGRWLGLQWREGSGEHWSDGTYLRAATAGAPDRFLSIEEGRFAIDDRWAGTWESSGWTVVLTDDPACPDARGTYHAHGEGPSGADLRFVKVVDTCEDGARATDLEAGVWTRQP